MPTPSAPPCPKRKPGRPKLPPAERMVATLIRLRPEHAEIARKLGNGRLSEGIRRALERAR